MNENAHIDALIARLRHCEEKTAEWDAAWARAEKRMNEEMVGYHQHHAEIRALKSALATLQAMKKQGP